jgi:hypothetical protein
MVQGDSLQPQFYKLPLSWLGTDADGRVVGYRYRWICPEGVATCPLDTAWVSTSDMSALFLLPVSSGAATYIFEVAAIDNDGQLDPTSALQEFDFFNNPPVVEFEAGTLPDTTLPAITFYLEAADPDTTGDEDDMDSRVHLDHYRVWLDGAEASSKIVPIAANSVTFREADFQDHYGARTVFAQSIDDGGASSNTTQHTWEVNSAPLNGILLVDDCHMGGALEEQSDASYRGVLESTVADVYRVLDVEALPRLSGDDLDATLSLFDKVVWYTDGDISSSGALELARDALLALLEERHGKLLLCSGLAVGTDGAFGPLEERFRVAFGITRIFVGPDSSTNFKFERRPIVEARLHDGLTQFGIDKFGLGAVMECFDSLEDETTRSLYFYPDSVYHSFYGNTEFFNPEQFDIGVFRSSAGGARAAYVSFPLGWPIRADAGDNRTEILELLRLLGIVEP